MGQVASDPYDHDNFLTIPQLEALSKKEEKLSLTQRRNRYTCKSHFIPHSSLRPFDIDNVPAKFNLQRLLQNEYILEAQVTAIKAKLPLFKQSIIQTMRTELLAFIKSDEMLRILTRHRFAGESCARSSTNFIPPTDEDLKETAVKEQKAAQLRQELLSTVPTSPSSPSKAPHIQREYPNHHGLFGDSALISSIPPHHSEHDPKRCGHGIREAILAQYEFLSDDALFCAYQVTRRRINIAVRYLVQELYDGLQLGLLYKIAVEKLDLAQARFKIDLLQNISPTHHVGSAPSLSVPYIQPPTFPFIARLYYSDAPYTPLVLMENILSLIYNLYRASNQQTLLSLGRAYLLLRAAQWKVLSAEQYYLKDQQCYALLSPKLISRFHSKFPKDLATKYAHDCLKRTDFNIEEAEDLYHREIQRREKAVATFKSMVLSTGGLCTASDRAIVRYLELSHWDYSIAVERYENAVLVQQDVADEAEYQRGLHTKTVESTLPTDTQKTTEAASVGTNDGSKALPTQFYFCEQYSAILSTPHGHGILKTLSSLLESFKSTASVLSIPTTPNGFLLHGPANIPTLSIEYDTTEGIDLHDKNSVDPTTIFSLSLHEQSKLLFVETSRCVSSYNLAQLEAQRIEARYSVLIDFDTRNIPLTTDHPWFKTHAKLGSSLQCKLSPFVAKAPPALQFNDFLDHHKINTINKSLSVPSTTQFPVHSLSDSPLPSDIALASTEGFQSDLSSSSSSSSPSFDVLSLTGSTASATPSTSETILSKTFSALSTPPPDQISALLVNNIPYEPNTEITKLFTLTGHKPASCGQAPSKYQQKHEATILSPLVETDLTILWVLPDRFRITPSQQLFIKYGGKRYVQEYLSRFNAKGNPQPGDVIVTSGHQSCSKYLLHIVVPETFSAIEEVMDVMKIAFQSIKSFAQLSGNKTLPLRVVQFTSIHNCIQNIPIYFSIHILHSFIRQYLDVTANRRTLDKMIVCMDDSSFFHIALRIACIYFPPPGYDSHKIAKMYEEYFLTRKREQIPHYHYIQSITPFAAHEDQNLVQWYRDKVENTKRFM